MPTINVHYEQAVYGSFAFWDRGYAFLAQSPGCRDEWLAGFRAACQRFGERPSGVTGSGGLFALRLERGPWIIVGVGAPGLDDRGRPGALAFHAIFVNERDYRKAGAFPFAFAGLLRNDWTVDTRSLSAGYWQVAQPKPERLNRRRESSDPVEFGASDSGSHAASRRPQPFPPLAKGGLGEVERGPSPTKRAQRMDTKDHAVAEREMRVVGPGSPPLTLPGAIGVDRAAAIAAALARGRRVAIEAFEPIDALAESVWRLLPRAVRERASVATWAFGNDNRFDLVAFPRLAGVVFDASYTDLATIANEGVAPALSRPSKRQWRKRLIRALPVLAIVAALAGARLSLYRDRDNASTRPPAEPPSRRELPTASIEERPPDPSVYDAAPPDLEERRKVVAGLLMLAERFGITTDGDLDAEPSALMIVIADRLRYRGPFLSAEEVRRLSSEPNVTSAHDRALAVQWNTRIRRFSADRALPEEFARGPLRWQLDVLAWSFHIGGDPADRRRTAPEIPHALAESLAVDVPVHSTPLAARYPALDGYVAFLGRLPKR